MGVVGEENLMEEQIQILLPGQRIHRAVLYFILGRCLRWWLSDAF
jgi:hypothetical protein